MTTERFSSFYPRLFPTRMASTDTLLIPSDLRLAQTVGQLTSCNPFSSERSQLERTALGDDFDEQHADWNLDPSSFRPSANLERLSERVEAAIERALNRAAKKRARVSPTEQAAYETLASYALFYRFHADYVSLVAEQADAGEIFARFADGYTGCFKPIQLPSSNAAMAHLFALQYQLYRAFHHVFRNIVGASPGIIQLRSEVWQSIFTHDVGRYRAQLFDRMSDFTTLITGPSGTGKELVARAIGTSAYIPFDVRKRRFAAKPSELFSSLNLSALSPALIESELFGHKKGSFTGAITDHSGWLETCRPQGTIFLDEIGELDESIQVKLLRVLQEREFQRLGESSVRKFQGRIVAATNRDVAEMLNGNTLRADFFFRICSDRITTPSLAARCRDAPTEMLHIVGHLLTKVLGQSEPALAHTITQWIETTLGLEYAWPGNVREVEQCIRSWLIRKAYRPPAASCADDVEKLRGMLSGVEVTADELVAIYCEAVYDKTRNYVTTARQLGLDRRTVKSKVDRKT